MIDSRACFSTMFALTLGFSSQALAVERVNRSASPPSIERYVRKKPGAYIPPPAPVKPSTQPVVQPPPRPAPLPPPSYSRPAPQAEEDETIDLSNAPAPKPQNYPSNSGGRNYGQSSARMNGGMPQFKAHFDFLMQLRPGVNPLTFTSHHTLLLVDFIPKPDVQFGFEVSPAPRYYEFDYQISKAVQFRFGKIWIPFDEMNPHNQFGGWINNSALLPTNGSAFLPDIWADLGIGFKLKPFPNSAFDPEFHVYGVNGFQDGGRDPKQPGQIYPDFGTIGTLDNNTDKSFGARAHIMLFKHFGIGSSVFSGRWSDNNASNARVTMVGGDAQLRFSYTELKTGYIGMNVDLPGRPGFVRGGFYGEWLQRFASYGPFKIALRGGVIQHDSRVIDVTDRTLAGGAAMYDFGAFLLSLEHFRDLNKLAIKTNYTYSALRFVVML